MTTKAASRGFTLIELIIVIAMIGILAAIALPQLVDKPRRTAEVALQMNLRTLRETLDQYKGDKGHYPATLDALVEEGYLRDVPMDPITKTREWDVEYEEIDFDQAPAESELPEGGQPGIIDVHSTSEAVGMNGVPYAEW